MIEAVVIPKTVWVIRRLCQTCHKVLHVFSLLDYKTTYEST
jgi:hypothetical protein